MLVRAIYRTGVWTRNDDIPATAQQHVEGVPEFSRQLHELPGQRTLLWRLQRKYQVLPSVTKCTRVLPGVPEFSRQLDFFNFLDLFFFFYIYIIWANSMKVWENILIGNAYMLMIAE
jgi:hypothetical protein